MALNERRKIWELFDSLPGDERSRLESQWKTFVFLKKQIIHREGFLPTGLFVIHKGKVKIYRIHDNAKEIIIHIAGEGEMVGYSALMRRSEYRFWAEAIERTELKFLPQHEFYECIETYPAFSVRLMEEFARQFDLVMDKMSNMLSDQVRARTAKTLLWLTRAHGLDDDNKTIKISLTRQDLAHLVATNTETLVRTLTDLKKEKAIALNRRKISVIDFDKLNKIAYHPV